MKGKNLLLLLSIFLNHYLIAQTWDEYIFLGKKERANGNYKKAGKLIAKGAKLKGSNNAEHYYYAAIMYTNAGKEKNALKLLSKSIDAGMYDLDRWERNKRLNALRPHKKWIPLKNKIKTSEQTYLSTLSNPELRNELKNMWKKDQDLVGKWGEQKIVIIKNTQRLYEIIKQHGWPTQKMVGKDGSWFAWAIAQHSHDLDFQKKCLDLLEEKLNTDQAEPLHYAELYDRICRNSNQKQKFGQAIIEQNDTKKFYPIQKPTQVDQRRAAIGLPALKVYANENYVLYER